MKTTRGIFVKMIDNQMHCANCGTKIVNRTKWKKKHLKACKQE